MLLEIIKSLLFKKLKNGRYKLRIPHLPAFEYLKQCNVKIMLDNISKFPNLQEVEINIGEFVVAKSEKKCFEELDEELSEDLNVELDNQIKEATKYYLKLILPLRIDKISIPFFDVVFEKIIIDSTIHISNICMMGIQFQNLKLHFNFESHMQELQIEIDKIICNPELHKITMLFQVLKPFLCSKSDQQSNWKISIKYNTLIFNYKGLYYVHNAEDELPTKIHVHTEYIPLIMFCYQVYKLLQNNDDERSEPRSEPDFEIMLTDVEQFHTLHVKINQQITVSGWGVEAIVKDNIEIKINYILWDIIFELMTQFNNLQMLQEDHKTSFRIPDISITCIDYPIKIINICDNHVGRIEGLEWAINDVTMQDNITILNLYVDLSLVDQLTHNVQKMVDMLKIKFATSKHNSNFEVQIISSLIYTEHDDIYINNVIYNQELNIEKIHGRHFKIEGIVNNSNDIKINCMEGQLPDVNVLLNINLLFPSYDYRIPQYPCINDVQKHQQYNINIAQTQLTFLDGQLGIQSTDCNVNIKNKIITINAQHVYANYQHNIHIHIDDLQVECIHLPDVIDAQINFSSIRINIDNPERLLRGSNEEAGNAMYVKRLVLHGVLIIEKKIINNDHWEIKPGLYKNIMDVAQTLIYDMIGKAHDYVPIIAKHVMKRLF